MEGKQMKRQEQEFPREDAFRASLEQPEQTTKKNNLEETRTGQQR